METVEKKNIIDSWTFIHFLRLFSVIQALISDFALQGGNLKNAIRKKFFDRKF